MLEVPAKTETQPRNQKHPNLKDKIKHFSLGTHQATMVAGYKVNMQKFVTTQMNLDSTSLIEMCKQ